MNASFEPKKQEQSRYSPRNESQSANSYPSRTIVHAKLEMTEPGDHDEQEADAVANTIMSGEKIARKISNGGGGSSGIAVSPQMESQLSQLQGSGRQMPQGLRNMMESGFGRDFSQVQLHTDGKAADMSSSIHAKAFTHGNDIYFNRGQFAPETSEGQRLVAHELTHVVQGGEKVGRDPIPSFEDPSLFYGDFLEKLTENLFCNHDLVHFLGSFGTCKNIFGTDYTGPWNPAGFKESAKDVQDTLSKVHDLAYKDRDAGGTLHALLNTDVMEADKFLATSNLTNAISSEASFTERIKSAATGLAFEAIFGLKQLGSKSSNFFGIGTRSKQDIIKIINDAYCNKELTDQDIKNLKDIGLDITMNCK